MKTITQTALIVFACAMLLTIQSCKKENSNTESYNEHDTILAVHNFKSVVYSGFPETFESGTKTAYAAANVTLLTGSWNLNWHTEYAPSVAAPK